MLLRCPTGHLTRQSREQRRDGARGHDMVSLDVSERVLGHGGRLCILGVLDDGGATPLLDPPQS